MMFKVLSQPSASLAVLPLAPICGSPTKKNEKSPSFAVLKLIGSDFSPSSPFQYVNSYSVAGFRPVIFAL